MSKKFFIILMGLVISACLTSVSLAETDAGAEAANKSEKATETKADAQADKAEKEEAKAAAQAEKVDKKIEKIGKVQLNDKGRIRSARKAYDKLSDQARKKVKKYKKLTAAEKKHEELYKDQRYKEGIAAYIRKHNRKTGKKYSLKLAGYFVKYGEKYKVDPLALVAIGYHESRFTARAYNPSGHYGMMQTSAIIGRNAGLSAGQLFKPKNSIRAAAKYFRYNLKYFRGNYRKAFAGYCAGTGGASRGQYNRKTVNKRISTRNAIRRFMKRNKYM